jgi:hypothetical protein
VAGRVGGEVVNGEMVNGEMVNRGVVTGVDRSERRATRDA